MCLPTNEIPPHSQSPAHGLNRQLCQRMRTHASFWGKKRQFGANFGIPCFGVKTPKSLNFRVPFTPPILGPKPPNSPILEPHSRLHFRTPILGQKTPIWGKFGQFWGPPFWSQNPQTPQFWGPFKPPILRSKPPKSPHFGVPLESPHSRLHFSTPILGEKPPIWGKFGRFWGPPFCSQNPQIPPILGSPLSPPF